MLGVAPVLGEGRTLAQIGPCDEDPECAAPDDDTPVARHVHVPWELVVKGAVRSLEGAKIEAGCGVPLTTGFAGEIHLDVWRVGQHDVLETNVTAAADVNDPHGSCSVVDPIDVAKLA